MNRFSPTMHLLAMSVLFLVCTQPVRAEDGGALDLPDRFMIRGGYLYVFGAKTDVQMNNQLGVGTAIDFENTLGGSSDYSGFRIDAAYRFNERHSLGISYYRFLLDANRVINEDVTVDDVTIAAGANVNSSLTFDMWRLLYNYSIYRDEKVELGLSPGLYIAKFKFAIAGSATCSGTLPNCAGQPTGAGSVFQQLTVPLPSLGGYVNYHFTPRLMSQVRFDWFYLAVGNEFTGSLLEFYAGLEYRLFKHFALGASYDRLQAIVELDKKSSSGFSVESAWNTVFLYGALYF